MAKATNISLPSIDDEAETKAVSVSASVVTRPTGNAREYVTTSIRFKRPVLAKLKKAAIDRNESLQQMIETALSEMFERQSVKIPGLRK